MQNERLRAVGAMASGIAHDINNALSPAALYVQSLLEQETSLSLQARRDLEVVQRSIDNVARAIARMREFSRPREREVVLAPVNLNDVLQQVADVTRARWSDIPQERRIVVRMDTDFATTLPDVRGHAVSVADGGQSGIESFVAAQQRGEGFAMVMTDLGMAYVDGRTVAAAIKECAPMTPVILLTGWGHRLMAENEIPEHVDRVSSKPPNLADLRTAIAQLTNIPVAATSE